MTPQTPRLLIADDNDANRLIALTILERAGYKMTAANNGAHALNLANLETYDLIVLDIMMPVMDGVRALRQLRRVKGPNQTTPVFALTAFSTTQDRQRYLLAGFDSVLSKPLRPGDMEAAVKRYIDGGVTPMPHQEDSVGPEMTSISEDEKILDDEIIKQLSKVGDHETLETIQRRYWASVEDQCVIINTSLPEALRGADPYLSEFRRAAHAIKGASAAIGLSRVAEVCRRMQNAPPLEISLFVSALIDTLSQSRPALSEALSGSRKLNPTMEMGREDESKAAHNR